MNTLDSLFDWVLNASARASVLVLAVLVVRMLLKKSLPARWRYALWLPVLAALVLPGIPLLPSSLFPSQVETSPPAAKAPVASLPEPTHKPETQPTALPTNVAPVLLENEVPVAARPPSPFTTAVAPEMPTVATAAVPHSSISWRNIFSLIWLAGVVLAVGFVGASYLLSLRRIRRRAVPAAPDLIERIARLSQSLGLRRAPRVFLSETVASPAVCGWWRPALLLNAAFPASLTDDEADMVLRHELTHIRRGDLVLNPLLCGLLALHWFNPLLWLAFLRIRADREAACDADVLRDEPDARRAAYGQTLLKMETAFPPSGLCLGFVGILQRGSVLRDRIQSIIAQPKLTALMKTTLALGIIGLAVLGLAKAAAPVAPEKAEETSLPSSQVKFPTGGNWGDETNGLSCRITPENGEYIDGEAIRVLVEIRNTSDKPVTLAFEPRAHNEEVHKLGPPSEEAALKFKHFLENPNKVSTQLGWFPMPLSAAANAKLLKQDGSATQPITVVRGVGNAVGAFVLGPNETYSEIKTTGIGISVENKNAGELRPSSATLSAEIGLPATGDRGQTKLESNRVGLTILPDNETTKAKRRVEEFERPMMKQLIASDYSNKLHAHELGETEEFKAKIRAFFANLSDRETRIEAISLLHSRYVYLMNQELAVELLGPFIRDGDPEVRERAAEAIAYRGCGAVYEKELIAMLEGNPPAKTLINVLNAMGRSKHAPFFTHVEKLVNHPDAEVQRAAKSALGMLAEVTGRITSLPFGMAANMLAGGKTEVRMTISGATTTGSPYSFTIYKKDLGTPVPKTDPIYPVLEQHKSGIQKRYDQKKEILPAFSDWYQVESPAAKQLFPSLRFAKIAWDEDLHPEAKGNVMGRAAGFENIVGVNTASNSVEAVLWASGGDYKEFVKLLRDHRVRIQNENDAKTLWQAFYDLRDMSWHDNSISKRSDTVWQVSDLTHQGMQQYYEVILDDQRMVKSIDSGSEKVSPTETSSSRPEIPSTLDPGSSKLPVFEGRGEWGPEVAGLSCRVTPQHADYEFGDPVRLLVEVRNTNNAPMSLGRGALSTIHVGSNKPFSTQQCGTLAVTFAQAKQGEFTATTLAEGKLGFFATYHVLFPKGTETETRTVVVQPKTTYSEPLVMTPWGPTLASLPSTAQPGKMNMSGSLMQLLKPEGKITQLEFKPVELNVKAKQETKEAGAKPSANPASNPPDNGIRLYTDQEAEAFRAKLDTLKYPTTPEAACEALGIDLKRLTGNSGEMLGSIDGRVGQSFAQLSGNYWISFQFQLYLQGPDSKPVQNDKGEHDKISIYARVRVREVQKKEDKLEVSIHDETLFVDAECPSGIGGTSLALTSGTWPKKVVVRLKYAADKPFTSLEGSGATLEQTGTKADEPRLKLDTRRFAQKNGFEAGIPPTEMKVLQLGWIDAYRN